MAASISNTKSLNYQTVALQVMNQGWRASLSLVEECYGAGPDSTFPMVEKIEILINRTLTEAEHLSKDQRNWPKGLPPLMDVWPAIQNPVHKKIAEEILKKYDWSLAIEVEMIKNKITEGKHSFLIINPKLRQCTSFILNNIPNSKLELKRNELKKTIIEKISDIINQKKHNMNHDIVLNNIINIKELLSYFQENELYSTINKLMKDVNPHNNTLSCVDCARYIMVYSTVHNFEKVKECVAKVEGSDYLGLMNDLIEGGDLESAEIAFQLQVQRLSPEIKIQLVALLATNYLLYDFARVQDDAEDFGINAKRFICSVYPDETHEKTHDAVCRQITSLLRTFPNITTSKYIRCNIEKEKASAMANFISVRMRE